MAQVLIYVAATVVFAVGLFPFVHHLIFGLYERRREVLSYFDDDAVKLYFKQFYQAEAPKLSAHPQRALRDIYNQRFGIRTFWLPGALYIVSLGLLVWIGTCSVFDSVAGWPGPKLESRGLYALAGAYFWVTWDLISHYRQRDVVPSTLYWYAFRFVISIPLAYALSTLLSDAGAPPVAFAIGAFPTNTLMLIVRRQGAQKFGLGDDTKETKLELETFQGVNTALAEKFSEVGVTTTLQLAYEDPIQLTMRTNLSFLFVTDVISQALATIYSLDLSITRPFSVRGAIEAAEVYEDLKSRNTDKQRRAHMVVAKLVEVTKKPKEVIERILHDITYDPYTDFLRNVWA